MFRHDKTGFMMAVFVNLFQKIYTSKARETEGKKSVSGA
jgi:hypothetical protein